MGLASFRVLIDYNWVLILPNKLSVGHTLFWLVRRTCRFSSPNWINWINFWLSFKITHTHTRTRTHISWLPFEAAVSYQTGCHRSWPSSIAIVMRMSRWRTTWRPSNRVRKRRREISVEEGDVKERRPSVAVVTWRPRKSFPCVFIICLPAGRHGCAAPAVRPGLIKFSLFHLGPQGGGN